MLSSRTHGAVEAVGLTSVFAAGCGSVAGIGDARQAPDRTQTIPSATTRHTTSMSAQSTNLVEDRQMKIVITLGEKHFGAVLRDSAASHDLLRQLPVTVDMIDHGGMEKTGPLRRSRARPVPSQRPSRPGERRDA